MPSSGYQPGKLISLVRNPSWDKATDFKPAYFDKIIIKNGGDVAVTSRQVLAGQSMMSGDSAVPPPASMQAFNETIASSWFSCSSRALARIPWASLDPGSAASALDARLHDLALTLDRHEHGEIDLVQAGMTPDIGAGD